MERKARAPLVEGAMLGHWTLLSAPVKVGRDYKVDCQCRCGTRKKVSAISLRAGHSLHCGCVGKPETAEAPSPESTPYSPVIIEELMLVSHGYLPRADQFRITDGAPTWTLASLARVLGISHAELMDHIRQGGARFADESKSQLGV